MSGLPVIRPEPDFWADERIGDLAHVENESRQKSHYHAE
jgi:hypothetical protein